MLGPSRFFFQNGAQSVRGWSQGAASVENTSLLPDACQRVRNSASMPRWRSVADGPMRQAIPDRIAIVIGCKVRRASQTVVNRKTCGRWPSWRPWMVPRPSKRSIHRSLGAGALQ